MKKYIVYMHINKINNKKYIGITSQLINKRWRNGKGYMSSPHFYNAINKYGWDNFEHIKLLSGLCEESAKEIEKQLISHYRTNNRLYGYNQTNGGDGISGYKFSDEQRKQMSERQMGYVCSEETKEKMRNTMLGRKFTEEWKQKISESHIGDKNPSAKPIVQLNGDFEVIKEFSCGRYAEEELGINVVNISQVCLGKAKSAGGYVFMFKSDYEKEKENLKNKSVEIKPYRRKVIQMSLKDEYIKTFNTIREASIELGIDKSSIINVCKGKRQKTAGGFKWRYAN